MVDSVLARLYDSGGETITTNNGRLLVDSNVTGGVNAAATTVVQTAIPLTAVDTEYSYALPADCKAFEFRNRGTAKIRYAFTTGQVATPTDPYFTLPSNWSYGSDASLDLTSMTVYFATSTLGQTIELAAWS